MIGFLTKYCLAQDQTLLNGPPHLNHPAFQPDAHPPSSWSDFNAHHGTIPNAADQARALDQLRDLYIIQSGRSPVIVNGEPAITIQVYTQICEPINIMLKMRYGQDANLWNTDRPWILPPGHELPGSAHPQWSPAVFNSRKFGTQSQLLGKTEQAGDSDGILSATLVDHPAFMEVKTWWSVSRPDLMAEFRQIANVGGGFYWGSSSQTDNAAVSLMKQMWGEFHSYQSRLGVFMNGQDIAFVIRTRRNELTFSEFMNWDSREVYTAFLGFSMVAVDAVLSGPADGYQERLRDIINTICPHEDREIRPDHHDHPGDDNDDDAGDEMRSVTCLICLSTVCTPNPQRNLLYGTQCRG
ncbi:hypothetical protein BV25DRAFT_967322 [Artomyces pyxidatus]|uniref:Uncharacterized protein n=1 Tax=Artomyces pyxidatus TaxID=48021 RepID=A0ACB8SVI2_9AGAM|nr:hypothetical protein BV25DRAFT_967322 [Artomyces pyxidatus]